MFTDISSEESGSKYFNEFGMTILSRTTRRYRVVIIDESHNLRNRETLSAMGYVKRVSSNSNESRVILLTATPYNKSYMDISNQLRLFIPEDQDLGGFSGKVYRTGWWTHVEFVANYQYSPNTLFLAFEKERLCRGLAGVIKALHGASHPYVY
jgi:hypothetical protein